MTPLRSLAAIVASAALVLLPAASPASAAPDSSTALQRLGACISGGGEGDMLLLLDRSGSLRRTDPEGARVDAATYVVRKLQSVAQAYRWKLNVAVAGFDTGFDITNDWTPLNPGTVAGVESALQKFRTEDKGLDTDYWAALDSARRELNERSTLGKRCPFIVWFSDGEFSVEPRAGGVAPEARKPYAAENQLASKDAAVAAEQAGKADLCRAGGVADQVRAQDIITLAVGLSTPVSKPDFSVLKSVATGEGGCGNNTSPVPGAFFTADGIDQLYQAFDAISAPGHDPIVQESAVCSSGEVCPTGTHRFVLDASIGSVHVLATTGALGQQVVLTGPNGEKVEFAPGGPVQGDFPGARLSGDWMSDRSVAFDLTRTGDQGWIGGWGMAFVAPGDPQGRARSSLHLYGDLLPAVADVDKVLFRAGDDVELALGLARADGSVVDAAGVTSDIKLSASIVQGGAEVPIAVDLGKGALGTPIRAALAELTPGPAALRMSLAVTTAPWASEGQTVPGTALEPQTRDIPITLLPPASYPVVAGTVDFGSVEKTGTVQAVVKLDGPGCVWLTGSTSRTTPDGVDAVTVTSPAAAPQTCVGGTLPLSIDVTQIGNGLASGTLSLNTMPEDRQGDPVPATVQYKLDMLRPANIGTLWTVLVGVTLAGIAIPLGLLHLMKVLTAKIPGRDVASASCSGKVDEGSSFVADGVPLTVQDLRTTVLEGADRRRVALAGGKALVAKVGLAPTETGFVVVEQPGAAAGGRVSASTFKGQARLPLAVQGHWSVALDSQDPHRGDVEVTVFTAAGGAGLAELLEDVRTNVGDWVARLRTGLPATPDAAQVAPADEWGGSSGAAGATADDWGGSASAPAPSTPAYPISYANKPAPEQPVAPTRATDDW